MFSERRRGRIAAPADSRERPPPLQKGAAVRPRTQITVLTFSAALTLAVGIPLSVLALRPSTELVEGTVVSVVTADNVVLIHSLGGARGLRGQTVVVRVPAGQRVKIGYQDEALCLLRPGQRVSVRVHLGSHEAQQISVRTET
jgi:hypothetical protein